MSHSDLSIKDIPEINVIIGKNDTGKTGLLKLLYATIKSLEIYSLKSVSTDVSFKKELADKLYDTFMPRKNGLGDLVRKGSKDKLDVNITILGNNGKYNNLYIIHLEIELKGLSLHVLNMWINCHTILLTHYLYLQKKC